jgi:hypothetical protein
MLNKLEHNLLSDMMDDWEPLHYLYVLMKTKFSNITIGEVLESLVRLSNLGLMKTYYYSDVRGKSEIESLSLENLENHIKGKDEGSLIQYPNDGEFYFEPTSKGRVEEAKNVYNSYYR